MTGSTDHQAIDEQARNEVLLRGRLSTAPAERVLPSGTRVITFRLVVPLTRTPMTRGSKQRSDWVECSLWSAVQRRRARGWSVGDTVEVSGALRRRHYRAPTGASSLVEVEVLDARRLVRARPASRAVPGSDRAGAERASAV